MHGYPRLTILLNQELHLGVIKESLLKAVETTIIHSDVGSQYTSELFEETLRNHGIQHSYSRKGYPGDNARIESFHSLLKREYVNFQNLQNIDEVIVGIGSYISWYNSDRISLVA